jgi:hypothetical protein
MERGMPTRSLAMVTFGVHAPFAHDDPFNMPGAYTHASVLPSPFSLSSMATRRPSLITKALRKTASLMSLTSNSGFNRSESKCTFTGAPNPARS